jgi:hypothetical protein
LTCLDAAADAGVFSKSVRGAPPVFRKLFQVAFVLGSLAGMASCGATDEGALNPSVGSTQAAPGQGDDDGGATGEDAGSTGATRGRTLLVQGGDVTFVGFDETRRRCTDDDGGVQCTHQARFSGTLIIRGAQLSLLPGLQDGDGGVIASGDDAGVTGAPGGDDGGVGVGGDGDGGIPSPRNALVRVDGAVLTFGPQADGDAGVGAPPDGDGGSSGTAGSAELRGGRMVVLLPREVDGDGGVGFGGRFDERGRRRELVRHVRAVVIQGAVFHLRVGGDADAGFP